MWKHRRWSRRGSSFTSRYESTTPPEIVRISPFRTARVAKTPTSRGPIARSSSLGLWYDPLTKGTGPPGGLARGAVSSATARSEEHTSELQSHSDLVCRLLLEKKKAQTEHRESGTCPTRRDCQLA